MSICALLAIAVWAVSQPSIDINDAIMTLRTGSASATISRADMDTVEMMMRKMYAKRATLARIGPTTAYNVCVEDKAPEYDL